MKRLLLSILCLLPFMGIWCQSSEFWFYEGKKWAKLTWTFYPEIEMATVTNVIQGSVEIEGLTYWKVFEAWKEDLSDLIFSGYYLREADRKVYWYEPDTKEEYLYMDFNLKQGDVFDHVELDNWELCVVAAGDTILPQSDGISRKYMKIGYPDSEWVAEVWIEGIGSLRSGIGPLCVGCTGVSNELLCCHDAEKSFYMNEHYNTCFRETVSINDLPGDTQLKVECTGKGNIVCHLGTVSKYRSLRIYDETGLLVRERDIEGNELQFSVLGIPSGVCLYIVTASDGASYKGKIYIE